MPSPRLFSRLLTSAVTTTTTKPSLLLTRTLSTTAAAKTLPRFSLLNNLTHFRAISSFHLSSPSSSLPSSFRTFATRHAYNDNQGNRPPKETILLEGCDFEHWLVVVEPPPQEWTREQIIDHYVKTLAKVIGSEDEARMKIYSVSTRHYFAFGALVSEELSYKLKELEGVRWVLPDSYLDVKNKDYGGEPFVDGVAAPYDPKYHEEWVRNNQKARDNNSRNNRPRNADRSRNFERRQQQRPQGFQNNPPLPAGGNMVMGGAANQPGGTPGNSGYGQNVPPVNPGYGQSSPPNNSGYGQNIPPSNTSYRQNMPPNNAGYGQNPGYARNMPPNNMGGGAPKYGGQSHPGAPPNHGGPGAPTNHGGPGAPPMYGVQGNPSAPPNYGAHGNPGYPNNVIPNHQPGGGMQYQNAHTGHQQNYVPPPQGNLSGQLGGSFQSQDVPGRDLPNL